MEDKCPYSFSHVGGECVFCERNSLKETLKKTYVVIDAFWGGEIDDRPAFTGFRHLISEKDLKKMATVLVPELRTILGPFDEYKVIKALYEAAVKTVVEEGGSDGR